MSKYNHEITTLPTAYRDKILEDFKDTLINQGYADLGRLRAMYIYQICGDHFLVRLRVDPEYTEQFKITWQRHLANLICDHVCYYS